MPRVAEIRTIDGEIWVRVGNVADRPGEITLWTPNEIAKLQRRTIQNFIFDLSEQWKAQQ